MRQNANIVITGHSRGLGAALAQILLERGCAVLALSRHRHPTLAARHPERLCEVALDLADTSAVADWLDTGVLARHLAGSTPALLINNAGMVHPIGPLGQQGARALAAAVAVNVAAPLMLTDAFAQATSGSADRRVLHISSGAARTPYAGWSLYCASKAALDHHARAVNEDALPALRIASVAPGVIDTAMQDEIRATSISRFPLRARFDELKQRGALSAPELVAQQLLDYAFGAEFGQDASPDLRSLPRVNGGI